MCVCSLRYSTCNACALYCHLWPARLYHIFPRFLIKGKILGEKSYWTYLIFSTPFVWNISHSEKNLARYDQKCILVIIYLSDFNETEFSWHIFEVCVSIKFHENLSSGSWAVTCGQMDRLTKLIVTLCKFVNMPKNTCIATSVVLRGETPRYLHLLLRYGVRDGTTMDRISWEQNYRRVDVEVWQLKQWES